MLPPQDPHVAMPRPPPPPPKSPSNVLQVDKQPWVPTGEHPCHAYYGRTSYGTGDDEHYEQRVFGKGGRMAVQQPCDVAPAVSEDSFCMMSSPEQLQAMQKRLSQDLFEMERQKAALRDELQSLHKQRGELAVEIHQLEANYGLRNDALACLEEDDRQTNKEWELELDKRQAELDAKWADVATSQKELEECRQEFECRSDVVELRKEMAHEKAEFKKRYDAAQAKFDAMVSDLEKKHQKSLREVRTQLSTDHQKVIDRHVKEALDAQAKEYESKLQALKKQAEDMDSKRDRDDTRKVRVLEQRCEQATANLERERLERKELHEASNVLAEDKRRLEVEIKGFQKKLQKALEEERAKQQDELQELRDNYEERLAISESLVETQSPTTKRRLHTPLALRQEEVVRQQQELLDSHLSKNDPQSASSGSMPPQHTRQSHSTNGDADPGEHDELQRAISEADIAARKDKTNMETWIRNQCLDMGIEDVADLEPELRSELERAYRSR